MIIVTGLQGDQGWHGIDGVDGVQGVKGERGYTQPYELAPRGEPGFDGIPGLKGLQGDDGYEGYPGRIGITGLKGNQGEVGETGLDGLEGIKGERGYPGPAGQSGLPGYRGPKGIRGDNAPPPPQVRSRGFIFARHSQSAHIPDCPPNTEKLWEGYSMASVIGASRTVGQDLGQAGSCLQKFSTMPFMFCDIGNVCSYAENNDDSLWLSTSEPMPMSMSPIDAQEMSRYISR